MQISIRKLSGSLADPFIRTYATVAGAVLLCCAVLLILTAIQGPRIRSATLDGPEVTGSRHRLVLRLNQRVNEVKNAAAAVSPSVGREVTSSGTSITIRFTEPLRSGQQYVVRIKLADGHVLRHTFTTTPTDVYYLKKDMLGDDHIRQRSLKTGDEKTVYSAEAIRDFVVVGKKLAVVVEVDASSQEVMLVDIKSGAAVPRMPAGAGSVDMLRAAPNGLAFGYVYAGTSSQATGDLMIYNLPTGKLTPVRTFQGVVSAVGWQFAPDGQTVAVQQPDLSVVVLAPGQTPLPLGQYSVIYGFTFDGTQLLLERLKDGVMAVDLQTLQERPFLPSIPNTFHNGVYPFHGREGYVLTLQSLEDGLSMQRQIAIAKDGARRTFLTAQNPQLILGKSTLSLDDQYLAVATSNQYTASEDQQTILVDIASGQRLAAIPSPIVRW